MKKAILCGYCGRLIAYSKSYLMKILDYRSEKQLDQKPFEYKARVCRVCSRKAGYKVKIIKTVKIVKK